MFVIKLDVRNWDPGASFMGAWPAHWRPNVISNIPVMPQTSPAAPWCNKFIGSFHCFPGNFVALRILNMISYPFRVLSFLFFSFESSLPHQERVSNNGVLYKYKSLFCPTISEIFCINVYVCPCDRIRFPILKILLALRL